MSQAALAARPRRSQEERSAETRARLLDATVSCLIDVGYARTTTTLVAERAGLSRGAQVHHFPKKADLVVSAMAHLATRQAEILRRRAEALPRDGDRVGPLLDLVMESFAEPIFRAALELWVAARTDRELHASLYDFERAAGRGMQELWGEVAGEVAQAPAFEPLLELTLHLARGMALQGVLRPDDRARRRVYGLWKEMVASALRNGASSPNP